MQSELFLFCERFSSLLAWFNILRVRVVLRFSVVDYLHHASGLSEHTFVGLPNVCHVLYGALTLTLPYVIGRYRE